MDEITELLTEELEGFKKSIQKIEGIAEQLNRSEVRSNISVIKEKLEGLKEKQGLHFKGQDIIIAKLNRKVARAKLTPKWLLGMFCAAIVCTMIVLGYAFYQISNLESREE